MAVHLKCAQCRRRVAVSRRHAGLEANCPLCGASIVVPAVETAICSQPAPLAPSRLAKPPAAFTQRRAANINWNLVGSVAAVAIVLVFIVGIVGMTLTRPKAAPAAPEEVVLVAPVADFEWPEILDDPVYLAADAPMREETHHWAGPASVMVYEPPQPAVVQRRTKLSDEDLRKQLLAVPELNLHDGKIKDKLYTQASFTKVIKNMPLHTVVALVEERHDLRGLPLRKGPDCQLGKEPAEDLQTFSRKLRDALARGQGSSAFDGQAVAVREVFTTAHGGVIVIRPHYRERFLERTVPTMVQMLTPESQSVRQALVDHLGGIKGAPASQALARIAIFDLSDKLRADALGHLRGRDHEEYRQVLLDGLRYPWTPVADHSAEALVVLRDEDAVPKLQELARAPDPRAPFFDKDQGSYAVRELVRVNHLNNCMMCHAPSKATTDLVRGRVPTPGEPLPPLSQYYESTDGIFVRADVTYLKQDFSVPQPVENNGAWPTMQRYDYLVRNKPLPLDADIEKLRRRYSNDYPQRDAVLYALKELTPLPERVTPPKNDLGVGLLSK